MGQRLKVYVRSSFNVPVVNLHSLWGNYSRNIWHVIGLVYIKPGGTREQAQILGGGGAWPSMPAVETPLGSILLIGYKLYFDAN